MKDNEAIEVLEFLKTPHMHPNHLLALTHAIKRLEEIEDLLSQIRVLTKINFDLQDKREKEIKEAVKDSYAQQSRP